MAQEPSQDQITEWSAQTLHEGMKKSIISELAKVMLSNTEIFDQVFKVHSSLSGVDHCLGLIWKTYKSKNFMYLVDPRDREVLYPDYKERCPWLERSELHGGKANRRPEELDLRVCTDLKLLKVRVYTNLIIILSHLLLRLVIALGA